MHALAGKKQSPEHIEKRFKAMKNRPVWPGGRPPKHTVDSLWANVGIRDPEECWPWIGWKNEQGYGRVEMDGRSHYAHRVIYELCHPGAITREGPKDKTSADFVRHACDNPSCCNPAHLLLGTHQENMQDMVDRGRKVRMASVESPRAKLTADDVRSIRKQSAEGVTRDALAKQFNVSLQTIKAVRSGRHYKDVTS